MKVLQSIAAAAALIAGSAAAQNQEAWLTLEGYDAQPVYEALNAQVVDGQKLLEGRVRLYCKQIVPNFPEGAQGIFLPVADCVAYPEVNWPAGVQGIVAPWFTLNGMQGNLLFERLPLEASERNEKIFDGTLRITAEPDLVVFEKLSEDQTVTVYDQAATEIYEDLGIYDSTLGYRTVSGEGSVSCHLNVAELPPGALGIAAPSASCFGTPVVDFPDGSQGIVAPWFAISGFTGYQLYRALDEVGGQRRIRSLLGDLTITCDMNGERAQCEITKR